MVLPSLFEEQIEHDTAEIDRLFSVHADSFGEASSFFPEIDDYNTGPDAYLELVEAAKQRVDIPVIASLNGTNIGGWIKYARLLEDAGADAIELNLYTVAADPSVDGAGLEAEHLELVALLTEEVRVPVAVKISPYYSSLAAFVVAVERAGASGVVMFNRFYAPDLDLDTLDVMPRISLSTQRSCGCRCAGSASPASSCRSRSPARPVSTPVCDAAKLILAGADVAMSTSAVLHDGPRHFAHDGDAAPRLDERARLRIGDPDARRCRQRCGGRPGGVRAGQLHRQHRHVHQPLHVRLRSEFRVGSKRVGQQAART